MERLYVFAPLALLGFLLLVTLWGRTHMVSLSAASVALALAAYGAGFVLSAWWMSYVPLWAAMLGAFAVSSALSIGALGRRMWVPVALAAVVPLTFLSIGNTGLCLSVLAVVALALTVWKPHATQVA